MKSILLCALLISSCSYNTISNVSSVLVDIFIMDDNCKDIIYRYNNLQDEKKSLTLEYEQKKKNNDSTDDILKDYEDRLLDLSFQIDTIHQKLTECNGGKTTTKLY